MHVLLSCFGSFEIASSDQTQRLIHQYFPGQKIKVALAGGVSANVRVNQILYALEEFENLFVQPAMGDAGLSMGAAILADIAET